MSVIGWELIAGACRYCSGDVCLTYKANRGVFMPKCLDCSRYGPGVVLTCDKKKCEEH